MTGREPVAVLGAGVKTPAGSTPDTLWQALCDGRCTAAPFHDPRLPAGTDVLVGLVRDFDPADYLSAREIRRLDRAHHLAIGAAQDAMDCVQRPLPAPERCAVVCGVGLGATASYETHHALLLNAGLHALSPLAVPVVMPSSMAAVLAMRFGFRGPCLTVSTACASGATAIGEGVELLRRGAADVVLAGGVDAMVTYNAVCGFLRLDAMTRARDPSVASRPFDADRDGFLLAEGSGFLVLQRDGDAGQPSEDVLGLVVGYGSCCDAHHLVAPSPDGEGALRCMRLALADAGVGIGSVRHVNAHGTSTPLNDLAEATALAQLFGDACPPVTAVKGTTGHLMGGSGAVEAIATLWSIRHGLVPPVAGLRRVDPGVQIDVVRQRPRAIRRGHALSNSFGFGGVNACLVLAGSPATGRQPSARGGRPTHSTEPAVDLR